MRTDLVAAVLRRRMTVTDGRSLMLFRNISQRLASCDSAFVGPAGDCRVVEWRAVSARPKHP